MPATDPPAEPLEPVAALRRIAFLLERTLASSYKVKAYRAAAATVLPLDRLELERRAADGSLKKLPGIGDSTAAVIVDCLAGRVPARLAELEPTAGPLAAGGAAYRAALRGDLHAHSDWSDGGSPIQEMAFTAIEVGHEYLVLTDHSPRLTVANGLSVERLTEQLRVVEAVNEHL
ncbi:MAG: PHP domain-containing protein, partial [Nocardioidaceae bacterium]